MKRKICPVWVGHLLANPMRKLIHNPKKILKPYVKENMNVVDFGCAMGFFSLPLAQMTGKNGKVICIDIQDGMLDKLKNRAEKMKLDRQMSFIKCSDENIGLEPMQEKIDFALAFAVVHETLNPRELFRQIHKSLKKNSHFLIAEPILHISKEKFTETVKKAEEEGYKVVNYPKINKSMAVLLKKI